jgi:hypothetical protein
VSHEVEIRSDELLEEHDRFDKAIVVAIVFTALVAAVVALGQMRALQRHDEAIVRSDQAAALASQASFTSNSVAQLQIDRFRLVQGTRARAEQAGADVLLHVGGAAAGLRQQASQWNTLAGTLAHGSAALAGGAGGLAGPDGMVALSQQLTAPATRELATSAIRGGAPCPGLRVASAFAALPGPITQLSANGPSKDPFFPTRYLAESRRPTYLLQAEGLLASQRAENEEKQFTRFGVSLTLFATAVFLFGFALSPYGRTHRHLYSTGAMLLVVGSSLWAIYAWASGPSSPAPAAATAYAEARVDYDKGDQADVRQARRLFTCAIARDPEFAPAYTGRALAENSITGPQDPTDSTNTELVSAAATRQAQADLIQAKALGAEDPTLPMIAGTDVFENGLRTSDRAAMAEGLRMERDALEKLAGTTNVDELVSVSRDAPTADPHDRDAEKEHAAALLGPSTAIALNIAEAELALGDRHGSRRAYRSAVSLANAETVKSGQSTVSYVSGALTDLNDLQLYLRSPAMQREIRFEKGYLARQFDLGYKDSSPHDGRGMTLGPTLTVLPALARFSIDRLGNADTYDVDAQWYYHSSHTRVWSAFPYLGGGQWPLIPHGHGYFADEGYLPHFSLNRVCLPSGDYKVEAYVDGHLAAARSAAVHVIPTRPADLEGMGASLCLPDGHSGAPWVELGTAAREPHEARRVAGLDDGYVSRDGRSGIVVFDVSPEADRQRCSANIGGRFIGSVIHQFARDLPPRLSSVRTAPFPFLGGQEQTSARLYSYPGGFLKASAAATSQGRVLVAAVYGPPQLFAHTRDADASVATSLLGSVSSWEGPTYGCD